MEPVAISMKQIILLELDGDWPEITKLSDDFLATASFVKTEGDLLIFELDNASAKYKFVKFDVAYGVGIYMLVEGEKH